MALVYLGLGSNLGEREKNCLEAIRLLKDNGVAVVRQSSLIETEPWGMTDQPHFINMAVRAETDLSPEPLLALLMKIETDMGRIRKVKWGPRIIDLDILFYDDQVIRNSDLTIPHPLMHEREFVLRPLAEIAPDKVHPLLKKTVRKLLDDLAAINQRQK